MQAKENLRLALLAAFNLKDESDPDSEIAAKAVTEVLCAFADVVRGPAPEVIDAGLVDDDSLVRAVRELTVELRKQNASHRTTTHVFGPEPSAAAPDFKSGAVPPPGAKYGFWQEIVGSSRPIWLEMPQPARTPPPGLPG